MQPQQQLSLTAMRTGAQQPAARRRRAGAAKPPLQPPKAPLAPPAGVLVLRGSAMLLVFSLTVQGPDAAACVAVVSCAGWGAPPGAASALWGAAIDLLRPRCSACPETFWEPACFCYICGCIRAWLCGNWQWQDLHV